MSLSDPLLLKISLHPSFALVTKIESGTLRRDRHHEAHVSEMLRYALVRAARGPACPSGRSGTERGGWGRGTERGRCGGVPTPAGQRGGSLPPGQGDTRRRPLAAFVPRRCCPGMSFPGHTPWHGGPRAGWYERPGHVLVWPPGRVLGPKVHVQNLRLLVMLNRSRRGAGVHTPGCSAHGAARPEGAGPRVFLQQLLPGVTTPRTPFSPP